MALGSGPFFPLAVTVKCRRSWKWWLVLGVFFAVIIGVPIFVVKRMRAARDGAQWDRLLARAVERVGPNEKDAPLVSFTFHTYSGFLVFFTQTAHNPRLPGPIAFEYLRQLHRYNLAKCLVPYPGIVYVPILSYFNYKAQQRRIAQQLEVAAKSPGGTG